MLSKLNWGGIPITMTSLIPGDGWCMLPRCAQLTSTYWQSHLPPHVYEYSLLSSELLSLQKSWFICHYHASYSRKSENNTLLSPFFINKLSLTCISSLGKDIWNISESSICRFSPRCLQSTFYKSWYCFTHECSWDHSSKVGTCFQFSYNVVVFFHKSCRHFKHIYSELLSVSEMLMLMGCVPHMCTGRI